jgi:hypothetical protein
VGVLKINSGCNCEKKKSVLSQEKKNSRLRVISSFPREVDEICALLGYYAAQIGNSLPKTQPKVPIFKGQDFFTLEEGSIGYVETSARNYHHTLRNNIKDLNSRLVISVVRKLSPHE